MQQVFSLAPNVLKNFPSSVLFTCCSLTVAVTDLAISTQTKRLFQMSSPLNLTSMNTSYQRRRKWSRSWMQWCKLQTC